MVNKFSHTSAKHVTLYNGLKKFKLNAFLLTMIFSLSVINACLQKDLK